MMSIPIDGYYIYREETEKHTFDIYIGPFESKKKATEIYNSMRAWNKKVGRTMNPKIVIDDRPDMKESWNIVFGDTINAKKSCRLDKSGINPYEWVLNLIKYLCETCLSETHDISKFHTNIDYIKYQLFEMIIKYKKELCNPSKPVEEIKIDKKVEDKPIKKSSAKPGTKKAIMNTERIKPTIVNKDDKPIIKKSIIKKEIINKPVVNKPVLKLSKSKFEIDNYDEDFFEENEE